VPRSSIAQEMKDRIEYRNQHFAVVDLAD